MIKDFDTLVNDVEQWSRDRGLSKADPIMQLTKLVEEVGELSAGLLRKRGNQIVDSIGDIMVVLTIMCQQLDINMLNCFNTAYEEIRARTGATMNGVFVKDEDLKK